MSIPVETALFQTAVRTFEDLAFMFPEPEADGCMESKANAGVSVAFRGPISGRLELRVSQSVLPALAANMLGDDEISSSSQQLDALGEIANVVCGNVLPAITNATEIFHLDSPRAIAAAELTDGEAGTAASVLLRLDDGWAALQLVLNQVSVN